MATKKKVPNLGVSDPNIEFHKIGLRYKFIYSMAGLFLGLVSMIGGIVLFLNGVIGSTSWTAKILGSESTISDAGPGAVLFVVGLFVVLITRLKVSYRDKGANGLFDRSVDYSIDPSKLDPDYLSDVRQKSTEELKDLMEKLNKIDPKSTSEQSSDSPTVTP